MQERPNDEDLKARLEKLSSDLQAQREGAERQAERKAEADLAGKSLGQAMNLGFRVLADFVAAIVVGALIGWQIDKWTGTSPLFLIVFLGLGMAAGFMSIYRLGMPPAKRDGGDESKT